MNITAQIRQDADAQERKRQLAQLLAARGARQISEHPVSRGQQALWFLHEAAPESPAYTVVCALRLRGALDTGALQRALQRIVDRHQQLRAGFHMQADGQLIQRIHGWREVALPRTQLPPMPAPELERVLMQAVARPFDLAQGPLFRPELFQIGPQEHILLLSVHHIVFDGWSLWLVMDELRQAYAAEAEGRDTGWSPLPMSYVDHLTAQEAMIASDDADAALAFWRDRLAGAQGVLDLPLDAPRPPLRAVRGESLRLVLPPALSQSLGGLARSLGTTTFSLLLGAWQILLARWSGQETVPVGTRSAGRGDPRAAGVVGYFVNPVVVVGHVDRAMRASDYLRATHAGVLEALAHDALPFPTLVERLQVPRDPSTTPLFQASFVLQKAQRGGGAMEMMAGAADWAGLGVEFVDLPQQAGQFDLDLDMFEVGDSLRGVLKYDAALFHPDSIARLAFEPGTRFEYSIGIDLLGFILERVAGQRLDAVLRERILDPLGMDQTGFAVGDADLARLAQVPDTDPMKPVIEGWMRVEKPRGQGYLSGGGGLVSTAADYMRFCRMVLNDGAHEGRRVLSPASLRLMLSDHTAGLAGSTAPFTGPGYGFGLGFAVRRAEGEAFVEGSAGDANWSGVSGTTFTVDRRENLAAILMAAAPSQRNHLRFAFRNITYGALTETGIDNG